ncbi:hypothetical protein BDP27DRAFT_1379936 [Rhodocollybia butyracea]|uniref:Uncharacterized protein n=1 Tax=Rhodocollybia butyracea TaxID=206335 RepID=A0A9P5Q139_9AGAR|nr:hypothetical protein BDP27DRAFT_1379936 [Rhodocollybia butyracea]
MSSAATRARREEDVQKAYDIQVQAGIEGAARATAVGTGLTIIGHYTWPVFRRQKLPFKAFLVSVCGLIFGAERALLEHEAKRRLEENTIRKLARLELAQKGIVPTETEIAKWRAENEQ